MSIHPYISSVSRRGLTSGASSTRYTYCWQSTSPSCLGLHPSGSCNERRCEIIVGAEGIGIPCLSLRKLVAKAISLHLTIHPVKSIRLVSHGLVVGCIYIVRDLAIGIEVPGGLAMKHLLLMTVGARRARRCLIVIHVVMVMMTVHVGVLLRLDKNVGLQRKLLGDGSGLESIRTR